MNKKGERNFKAWMPVKENLHYYGKYPSTKEGEVWWASVGENVGSEICGKGETCSRPVLIFKKLDKYSFWAIPLTSKNHSGSWYAHFKLGNREQIAVISQIVCMSVLRLHRKMGELTNGDFEKVKNALNNLITKNTP